MQQLINLSRDKNIILVDTSYYVFYRYFATYRWFSFQKIEVDVESIISNEVFMNAFYKHVQNDMKKLCKKWNTTIANIVFCMDCMRCDIWRNDIYDQYKASRIQSHNFNGKIFPYFYDYISKMKIQTLNVERLEGDDVIYLLQSTLKKKIPHQTNLVIITNDNDFLQLIDTNVIVFNMQFKELKTRGTNNAKVDLYMKAIYGDKSDNIPKIAAGITKEKAISIASMSDDERIEYMKENNMYDKFLFNMKLISFENIPKEHVAKFNKSIKLTFS
jgi:5'-3' exonuclease